MHDIILKEYVAIWPGPDISILLIAGNPGLVTLSLSQANYVEENAALFPRLGLPSTLLCH